MATCHLPPAAWLLFLTLILGCGAGDTGPGTTGEKMSSNPGDKEARCKKEGAWTELVDFSSTQTEFKVGEEVPVSCRGEKKETFSAFCVDYPKSHGAWNISGIKCLKMCNSWMKQVEFQSNKTEFQLTDTVTVTCRERFESSSFSVTCVEKNGRFEWTSPEKCVKKCVKPSKGDPNLQYIGNRTFYSMGEKVEATCLDGFQPSQSSIECIRNEANESIWNATVTCIRKCKNPEGDDGWDKDLLLTDYKEFYDIDEEVNLSCSSGYQPSEPSIKCIIQGEKHGWNDTSVRCIEKCTKPQTYNRNVQFTPDREFYNIDEEVTLSCSTYGLEPSEPAVKCLRQGNRSVWNQTSIWCIGKCGKYQIQDSHIRLHPDKSYYSSSEFVHVSCTEGYELLQSVHTISCFRHSTWNTWSDSVSCIENCKNFYYWDNRLQFTPKKASYASSESVTVTCPPGYQLSPNIQQIRCERIGSRNEWRPSVTCIGKPDIVASVLKTTATSITLRWVCRGDNFCSNIRSIDALCQQVPRADGRCQVYNGRQAEKREGNILTCSSLRPFSRYSIAIYGSNHQYTWSPQEPLYNMQVYTNEKVPEKPAVQPWNKTTKELRWEKLSDCSGNIIGYQFRIRACRDYNLTFEELMYPKVDALVIQYKLDPWKPGTNYTVNIRGLTSAGPGEAAQWMFETEITEPVIPSDLMKSNISTSRGTIVLPLHWVPDLNGPISEYQIVISCGWDRSENDVCQSQDLPSFNATLKNLTYITAAFLASNVTDNMSVIVGDGAYYHGYYNAPLSPGHNCTAFLRVISVWKQDRKVSCATYGSFDVSETPEPANSILGLVIALCLLFLLLLVAVLVVYWKLRSSRSRRRKSTGNSNGFIRLKMRGNLGRAKTEIPVADLLTAMKRFRRAEILEEELEEGADREKVPAGRMKEYQRLDSGLLYPCEAGMAIDNRNKNRYKNIVPCKQNPSLPEKPAVQPWNKTTKELRWEKLSDCSGNIIGYQFRIRACRDYNLTFEELMYPKVDALVIQYKLDPWKPGTNYTVNIRGLTSAGPGEAAQWMFETEITEPVIPSDLMKSNISTSRGTIVLPLHWVPDLNGPISEYQIVISCGWDRSENDVCQSQDLPSFNATLKNLTYITAAFPASNVTDNMSVIVGDGAYYHGYYNAPLSPGHNCTAFLRVISVWKQDRKVSCATYGSFDVSETPEPANSILGLVIALCLLFLLLLVAVLVVYWKLRSSRSRRRKSTGNSNGFIRLKMRGNLGRAKTEIPVADLLTAMKRFRRAEILEEEELEEGSR
ncbi:uncharacterized protein LOC115073462 [Rhinatrema bivittatum]|uniref:uncharacterized protein LOC115073462 n=1 Tax=Rhinatrema bivittatum TaxID=194408 RepID=UPI00112BC677|nr:uncharacterized protein LOC115073462 [Rhinatrema bivittatum]